MINLAGRPAVLAAAGDTPYTRLTTTGSIRSAYQVGRTVAWIGDGSGWAVGDGEQAAALFVGLAGVVRWLHLPRVAASALAPLRPAHQDDWDFLWTVDPPPSVPGEERVVPLEDRHHPEINRVLDEALPRSTTRPGDPRAKRWYGIFQGDRLIACGADRSRPGVGFLAALAVAPDHQGRGLGAAITAAITRRLFTEYDVVALGVMWDNAPAISLYRRLGFTAGIARTSVSLPPATG